MLLPLPVGFREKVGSDIFLEILNGREYDRDIEFLAYNSSAEVVWSDIAGNDLWLPDNWETGELFPITAGSISLKRRQCFEGK